MRTKGFTLIELLAVIVILAIIALIATPIILGIITDTRNNAKKRSAELVYKGVEYAYTQTLLTTATGNNFTLTDINDKLRIENVISTTINDETLEIITKDGVYCGVTKNTTTNSIDVVCGTDDTDFTQDDVMDKKSIVYSFTNEVNFKPQYYLSNYAIFKYIGNSLPTDKTTDSSTLDYNVYLGYDGNESGKITAEYVCFVIEKEYCLKHGEAKYDGSNELEAPSPYYDTNIKILNEAFGEDACALYKGSGYSCSNSSISAATRNDGMIKATISSVNCGVMYDGYSSCQNTQ